MKEYHDALKYILENGKNKSDRTNTDTRSVFGMQMRFNLQLGFPAVTTKKLAWKSVVSELLWFMEGSGDERRLAEILHGTRDPSRTTIWSGNAEADYWKSKAKFEGDLGRVYGVQWRHWKQLIERGDGAFKDDFGNTFRRTSPTQVKEIDQLANLIEGLKRDPNGRRHIMTAWNPGELDQMALPPCHVLSQFDVTDGKLNCQLYQRSCDMGLGVPFNIASYSLLTHMIAQICNLKVGEFIWTGGDCHIYNNHIDAVKEQLSRDPKELPILVMPNFSTLDELSKTTVDQYTLKNYQHYDSIKMVMAV